MAIKNLIARGIGFSPGSVKFMPTLGLSPVSVVAVAASRTRVLPFHSSARKIPFQDSTIILSNLGSSLILPKQL